MNIDRRTFAGGVLLTALAAGGPLARAAAAVGDPTQGDWRAFDDYLKGLATAGSFSGAVLVAKNGRPILRSAYGMADKSKNEANSPETLFCIGSMGKMITSVAVAHLVQRGRLAFQDTIGKYVRGFPSEIADRVTVHHLLTHTSGMGEVPGQEDDHSQVDIDVLMKGIVKQPLDFEPGTRMQYSNAGFIVLGAIVQHVGKQKYTHYVREHILAPARMHHTFFGSWTPDKVPHMAHPYALFDADGQWIGMPTPNGAVPEGELRDLGDRPDGATPAGGALSTVGDMFRFAQALLGHRLLNARLTQTIMEGKVQGQNPDAMYAYGFSDEKRNGTRIVGHNGGIAGYWSELDMYPTKGYTIVFLTNQDFALFEPLRKSRSLVTGG
ncbi:serine hydrolase domain-containing protein [Actinomadura nitritigenes]|uniref:serine hydrolase domain-containing protein n=1 Tax=Actinomadura nitritigenes TaxID=134602 RepID=UPI003D8BB0C6